MRIRLFWLVIGGLALACLFSGVPTAQSMRGNPDAAKVKNPVAATPESIAAGKQLFQRYCTACHGEDAKGAPEADVGPPPTDLTDAKWDHGSSDGEIFYTIKHGVPPGQFMGPWDGLLSDTDIWNVINYIRSLGPQK